MIIYRVLIWCFQCAVSHDWNARKGCFTWYWLEEAPLHDIHTASLNALKRHGWCEPIRWKARLYLPTGYTAQPNLVLRKQPELGRKLGTCTTEDTGIDISPSGYLNWESSYIISKKKKMNSKRYFVPGLGNIPLLLNHLPVRVVINREKLLLRRLIFSSTPVIHWHVRRRPSIFQQHGDYRFLPSP